MTFRILLFAGVLHFFPLFVFSQNTASVSGTVKSATGEHLIEAVVILENTSYTASTDANGNFIIQGVPEGNYTLVISYLGYVPKKHPIKLKAGEVLKLHTLHVEEEHDVEQVIVTGKNEKQKIEESTFNVNVIDTKRLANTTADLNQVLNRSTGVRVREQGGLGSSFNFSLNGFSGNQVKFFIDGVPMTNFSSSLGMNTMPVNLAERIEVYKGVVPVWLGSDALGGAVNIITNQKVRNYVDASYSYGSFNTHRVSLNARGTDSSGLTANANVFLNYSDNNYYVSAKIPDDLSGVFGPEKRYRHFNDRYKSAAAIIEGGVIGKKYADRLLVGVMLSADDKQIQQGANMTKVAGQAFEKNQSVMPTLKYKKDDLFIKGLSLNFFGSYNFLEKISIDSSSRRYKWDGSYTNSIYATTKGELTDNKTYFIQQGKDILTTTNLSYEINKHHSFGFNHTYSNYKRSEEDRIRPYRLDLAAPQLRRNTFGLAYKLVALQTRLSVSVFGKVFDMYTNMRTIDGEYIETRNRQPGYGVSASYFVVPSLLQVVASYENTYRMPGSDEVLGDGVLNISNPLLKPEQSKNINVGIRLKKRIYEKHEVKLDAGFIYRDAIDFIRASATGPQTMYKNERNVRVTGFDAAVRYEFKDFIFFEVNGTYQNIVNVDQYDPPGSNIPNYLYLLRLPNMPYLFGNASLDIMFKKVAQRGDRLTVNLSSNYLEGFYLFWPTLGDPVYKREIPTQLTYNAGLTYSFPNEKFNMSFECRNLTDVQVYDYFNVQKPGRSFSVKVRYFIKK